MLNIKLTEQAHVEGYGGAFYRFHTENGALSASGIWDNWYEAAAVDQNGNEYRIVWEISNHEAFISGDEDCCDWENPAEIYSYTDGKPVEAEIDMKSI